MDSTKNRTLGEILEPMWDQDSVDKVTAQKLIETVIIQRLAIKRMMLSADAATATSLGRDIVDKVNKIWGLPKEEVPEKKLITLALNKTVQ